MQTGINVIAVYLFVRMHVYSRVQIPYRCFLTGFFLFCQQLFFFRLACFLPNQLCFWQQLPGGHRQILFYHRVLPYPYAHRGPVVLQTHGCPLFFFHWQGLPVALPGRPFCQQMIFCGLQYVFCRIFSFLFLSYSNVGIINE